MGRGGMGRIDGQREVNMGWVWMVVSGDQRVVSQHPRFEEASEQEAAAGAAEEGGGTT